MKKTHNVGPLPRTTYSAGLEIARAVDYFPQPEDFRFMGQALKQARIALRSGNVPIGAVLVAESGQYWAAHSTEVEEDDPYAHAEANVTRKAKTDGFRLSSLLPRSRIYVTMEPCIGDAHFLAQGGIGTIFAATAYSDAPRFVNQREIMGHDILANSGRSLTVIHGLLKQEALDLMVTDNKRHQSNPQAGGQTS